MEAAPFDRVWRRGRTSMTARVARLRSKSWQIGQCAIAAGVAWFIAAEVVGHPTPFFAPVAAVVSLGTSYGQRLRRVLEVTIGVALGVFVADLLVLELGVGPWQLALIVALAMSVAFLLDGGQLLVTQAAVQSIIVTALVPAPGDALDPLDRRPDRRWRGAGGGDGGAGGAAAPAARAGGGRGRARSRTCCGPPPT